VIQKIISGAQTGADRAGIDAAIESGMPYGGWIPKGRKAEDGTVPDTYTELQELTRGGYPKRTEQNVIDTDGTVIFTYGKLSTGSALTAKFARQHNRPYLHIDLDTVSDPVMAVKDWMLDWDIKVLNVAGRSASKAPGIYDQVKDIIKRVIHGR
jgi:hypothetical protein